MDVDTDNGKIVMVKTMVCQADDDDDDDDDE